MRQADMVDQTMSMCVPEATCEISLGVPAVDAEYTPGGGTYPGKKLVVLASDPNSGFAPSCLAPTIIGEGDDCQSDPLRCASGHQCAVGMTLTEHATASKTICVPDLYKTESNYPYPAANFILNGYGANLAPSTAPHVYTDAAAVAQDTTCAAGLALGTPADRCAENFRCAEGMESRADLDNTYDLCVPRTSVCQAGAPTPYDPTGTLNAIHAGTDGRVLATAGPGNCNTPLQLAAGDVCSGSGDGSSPLAGALNTLELKHYCPDLHSCAEGVRR